MNKAYLAVVVAAVLSVALLAMNFSKLRGYLPIKERALAFSKYEIIENLWVKYKNDYLEPSTFRTLDRQRSDITTSEGQSYTMLRAVWVDDKDVFDKSWEWTKNNLQHKQDKLFSWLFGKKNDGSYGVINENGGQNTASDADIDIALSLIMAANRWGQVEYLNQARLIIKDIWKYEVLQVNNRFVLLANNLEKFSTKNNLVINPSYFSPHAYIVFAKIDSSNNWNQLALDTYVSLSELSDNILDKIYSSGLPPDWVYLDKTSGKWNAINLNNLTTNYSYDAIRTPWRISLDYIWNGSEDAKSYLAKLGYLATQWSNNQKIYTSYFHDGSVAEYTETLAMYATSLGYFCVLDATIADQIYNQKLLQAYYDLKNDPDTMIGYYDHNWLWFGVSMYHNTLFNLTEKLSQTVGSEK